jgi:two-component system chemotaxis sensor kinase CheA
VGEAAAAHTRLRSALAERLGRGVALPPESDELGGLLRDLQDQASRARMVPVAGVVEPLRRAAREVARAQGKDVRFEVVGEDTELDRAVLSRLSDPLLHLVRNAVDHGVEPPAERAARGKQAHGTVRLEAAPRGGTVQIVVSDDGRGIDLDRVQAAAPDHPDPLDAIFQPGFSTAETITDVSGRGVGLDVVRAALDPLRGRVEVRSEPGRGAAFVMTVPLTVAAVECLIVEVAGRPYALPVDHVAATLPAEPHHTSLAAVLDLEIHRPPQAAMVLSDGEREATFAVASVVDRRDLVITGLGRAMPPVPVVSGAAIDSDGHVVIVLDPVRLLDRADRAPRPIPEHRARILVVDDAAVVRQVQHAALTRAGYEVQTAVDGADALARLRAWPADLVLVDIEMPVMDGLDFTVALRNDPALRGTAVLMLTSLGSDESRRRGMEAGADGYLVKGRAGADDVLEAVARLLGRER